MTATTCGRCASCRDNTAVVGLLLVSILSAARVDKILFSLVSFFRHTLPVHVVCQLFSKYSLEYLALSRHRLVVSASLGTSPSSVGWGIENANSQHTKARLPSSF